MACVCDVGWSRHFRGVISCRRPGEREGRCTAIKECWSCSRTGTDEGSHRLRRDSSGDEENRAGASDLAGALIFANRTYRRIAIHRREHYEAMVLCWKSGQRSAIHNHAGSACVVRVVEGRATETRFVASPCGGIGSRTVSWLPGRLSDGMPGRKNDPPDGQSGTTWSRADHSARLLTTSVELEVLLAG